ncbi:MAG: Aromatic-L-amino-acid decarboxylase [uncultured Corynebacteriales bacterium]|uniref:Aromatic-L-amino-acid decarboxylase n=1 Tax=uncultured Mycobacteriales bacterium TaxID=581187 RepID=A0A6J4HTZ8_9ACTN|nr:MAG: Aromatic-L-amino-acid decarboxylase [uncultured Corynebacteriales bacterium]
MTPEEFRAHGRQVVDWIADYWESLESRPVRSSAAPGEVAAALPAAAPETGEPFEAVLADLDRVIMPGITHWQHPSFFGYFPANASGPAVLADLLSSGLGVQGMLWATSPAATELETVTLDWLAGLLDLPERFRGGHGVIQDTASSALLCALLAALHRRSGGSVRTHGVRDRYAVYLSAETHSSAEKAVRIAGLGDAAIRLLDVDADHAVRVGALRAAVEADLAAGVVPLMLVATVGTTSTTAVDPVRELGEVCREHGIWLHVDAAYAGVAAVCPELRWVNDGLELADSYSTNPHKWLLTNFDCDAFWVAEPAHLVGALSVLPEYLRNAATEAGTVIDYRDWQVPLGRRFRALKLWAVLRWYGARGLREHIRGHVALAREFAGRVAADPRFALVAPHPLSLVTFRLVAGDEASRRLLEAVNDSGRAYLSHTRVAGRYVLRLAIGATSTERRHVEAVWALLQELAPVEEPARP